MQLKSPCLFPPTVISVKCIMCDPEHEGMECKETVIDCSKDHELGGAFDSCFTYQMVVASSDGELNFTHIDKNCSIRHGCTHLKNVMCERYNFSLEGAVQSCDILCCDSSYCNVGEPKFTTRPQDASAHTRATTWHNVLAYKSSASRQTGDKWKLFFGTFCLVIYSMVSRILL